MNGPYTHPHHNCKYQRDYGESHIKRQMAYPLPPPLPLTFPLCHNSLMLSKTFPGSQQPQTRSEGCTVVLTRPNSAWQSLINKLLEATGTWINAKKHPPKEIRMEILQSRKLLGKNGIVGVLTAFKQLRLVPGNPISTQQSYSKCFKDQQYCKNNYKHLKIQT